MKTYQVEREGDEQPRFIPEDAERLASWQQLVRTSGGELVIGYGPTPEDAIAAASRGRNKREAFLNRDPKDIIRELISRDEGCRGTQEQNDFNRAVARVLGIEK